MGRRLRGGVSLELVAILGIVAVVIVGVLVWRLSPAGRGELVAPDHVTVDAVDTLESGISAEGRPYLGRPDAAVTIIEFSDFQCPFCRDFARGKMSELIDDYIRPGKARLEFVVVGFDGEESVAAGKAGLCAGDQGRFWPMYDWLYANQSSLQNGGGFSRERLLTIAERAGVDATLLAACMDEPATSARFEANESFARAQSVGTTPNFLVGDRLVQGPDIDAIRALVDAALAR